jgi:LysR family carnitine catabolism transcriptional activator
MNEPAQRQSGRPLAALSLRHLHYFVTLAGTLSFRRAADLLAITSPALSHSIAETERLLNARLFDRQGREVALSQIGEAILPLAERLLNNADGTIADMVDVARNVEQTVKLALIPSMARGVCALLSELQLKHHGLKFEFLDMPTDHIVRAVETGEVDIGVGVAHWAIGKPLETAPMTADEIVAVIRKDHQLAGSEETTWAILQAHPLAHFVRGSVVDLAGGSVASRQVAIQARYQVTFTERFMPWYARGSV